MLKIQPYSLHTIRRWGIHPLSTLVTTPVSLRLRWPYRYLQFLQIFTTKTVQIAKIFEWEYSGNAPGSTSEDIHQKHHWHKVSLARESVILSPPKRSNRSFQYHWNPNWTCYDHVTPTYQLPLSPKRRRWQHGRIYQLPRRRWQRMVALGRLVTLFTLLSSKEPQTIVGMENTKQGWSLCAPNDRTVGGIPWTKYMRWQTTQSIKLHTKVILTKSYSWVFERSKD